jgi:CheY-like chemotaxis protein
MTLTKAVHPSSSWQDPEILIFDSMRTLPHILIIDDDEIFIFLTKKILQSSGMVESISICRSAIEAIELLHTVEHKWPDLIMLDLNMPGMNGWEFLQHYQSLIPGMKKLPRLYVVSSSIADNDTERARKIKGVDGYIAKPLTTESIREILKKATP